MTEPQSKPADSIEHSLAFQREELTRATNHEAIAAGLDFLFSRQQGEHWSDFSNLSSRSEIWVTARVLV
ncbi:MAG: hypothetical protein ACRD4F_07595, partial [Candidatus Angelobacter sp.]